MSNGPERLNNCNQLGRPRKLGAATKWNCPDLAMLIEKTQEWVQSDPVKGANRPPQAKIKGSKTGRCYQTNRCPQTVRTFSLRAPRGVVVVK